MAFAAYANTGPFTNNVTPPSLSAYNNNIESFLDQIVAPLVADSHVSADGLGNVTTLSITLTSTGTGLTVQHNATVSGILTTTGNHVANGGMNVNTIRDNTNGNTAIDLSAGSGLVKLPHGATLTGGAFNLLTGSISRLSIFTGTANSSGTLQAHGLGATPDFCVFQQTNTAGDVNTFQWDKNASDGTNVKVWSNNATARQYIALAIKL